jgi:hypothetical protein
VHSLQLRELSLRRPLSLELFSTHIPSDTPGKLLIQLRGGLGPAALAASHGALGSASGGIATEGVQRCARHVVDAAFELRIANTTQTKTQMHRNTHTQKHLDYEAQRKLQ